MPRIRCRYLDCVYLDDRFCASSSVDIDPDEGCITYTQLDDVNMEKDWEEDDLEEMWDIEDIESLSDDEDEDDDDLWLDEDF